MKRTWGENVERTNTLLDILIPTYTTLSQSVMEPDSSHPSPFRGCIVLVFPPILPHSSHPRVPPVGSLWVPAVDCGGLEGITGGLALAQKLRHKTEERGDCRTGYSL